MFSFNTHAYIILLLKRVKHYVSVYGKFNTQMQDTSPCCKYVLLETKDVPSTTSLQFKPSEFFTTYSRHPGAALLFFTLLPVVDYIIFLSENSSSRNRVYWSKKTDKAFPLATFIPVREDSELFTLS